MEFNIVVARNDITKEEFPMVPAAELHEFLGEAEPVDAWFAKQVIGHKLNKSFDYTADDSQIYIALHTAFKIAQDYPGKKDELADILGIHVCHDVEKITQVYR